MTFDCRTQMPEILIRIFLFLFSFHLNLSLTSGGYFDRFLAL